MKNNIFFISTLFCVLIGSCQHADKQGHNIETEICILSTRRIVKDGFAYNEGFVFGGEDRRPFGISWRALIPKSAKCTNLITPTCLSFSYVAYGAIKILPTFMILGQRAGLVASMALDQNIPVQEIDYTELRRLLLEHGQILEIPDNWLEIITAFK
jgi:hypothetical protein